MGGPGGCYRVLLPKPLMLIFLILDHINYAISRFLLRLGLPASLEYPLLSLSSSVDDDDYAILSPLPAIKSQLGSTKLENLPPLAQDDGHLDLECAVCLRQLKGRDEVRKLGNCPHLFHTDCIDTWVDLGSLTCPLCRAPLLPDKNWSPM